MCFTNTDSFNAHVTSLKSRLLLSPVLDEDRGEQRGKHPPQSHTTSDQLAQDQAVTRGPDGSLLLITESFRLFSTKRS